MPDPKLDTLLARLVDETITETEFQELEQLLDNSADAQRRYLHYMDLHADLQNVDEVKSIKVTNQRQWATGLLALATILVLACFFLWQDARPTPMIQIIDADGAVRWLGDGGKVELAVTSGQKLPSGTLETRTPDASVELAFFDGTTLSLTGRSALMVSIMEERKVLRLREGNLSIDVVKQAPGKPLQVFTPSSEAEVLGTQFSVKANEFSSQYTVNEGRVRVKRITDGQIQEVTADQEVVSALELGTDFTATSRRKTVTHWQSDLLRDRLHGHWEPDSGMRAMPHLWKGTVAEPETPVLLYSVVLDPSTGKRPPVQLTEGTRLKVQGRIDRPHPIYVGFGTNRARGGPISKYSVRNVKVTPGDDDRFTLELALSEFSPNRARFPLSPAGQEIDWLWIQTVNVDAGLVVEEVVLSD